MSSGDAITDIFKWLMNAFTNSETKIVRSEWDKLYKPKKPRDWDE